MTTTNLFLLMMAELAILFFYFNYARNRVRTTYGTKERANEISKAMVIVAVILTAFVMTGLVGSMVLIS